jgi:DNA invertase Pin-like site-specific DNA recombinase
MSADVSPEIVRQAKLDTDQKHGEHILGMVGEANEKRRPDPLIRLLEKAHQARLDAERGGTPGGDEAA